MVLNDEDQRAVQELIHASANLYHRRVIETETLTVQDDGQEPRILGQVWPHGRTTGR